ncbi:MAG: hypothetical protein MRZ79_01635 [Bacteroidia bacterium]|nr:hypothetical protein [Bacteroidia bacterium]
MIRNFVLVLVGLIGVIYAQIPQGISFQGIARDVNGDCMANTAINIDISILESSTAQTGVYTEDHDVVQTDTQGVYTLTIGRGHPSFGNFAAIDWSTPKWVKLDINGATVATVELMSVPFAFQAEQAVMADSSVAAENGKSRSPNTNNESLTLLDSLNNPKIQFRAGGPGQNGQTDYYGANGFRNVGIGSFGDPNRGAVILFDENNEVTAQFRETFLLLNAPGVGRNARLGNVSSAFPEYGQLVIYDQTNTGSVLGGVAVQAFADPNNGGIGTIEAFGPNGGVKHFVMPHPSRPGKEIVYACIEGPEVAAYERGRAELVNGEAEVSFSDHFGLVVNASTLTISLTPYSAKSKGLAIIEQTERGFKVKELLEGTGTYSFSWRAEGVRKGHEDFQVIREKREN